MADSSGGKSGGAMQTILIAIVIAIATGSSAPFWWNIVFPKPTPPPASSQVGDPKAPDFPVTAPAQPQPQAPATPKATMGALEQGTNLQGGDLSGYGLAVNSTTECSNLCLQNEECKAMTFVRAGNGGVCWLKSAVPAGTPNASMISAVKIYSTP